MSDRGDSWQMTASGKLVFPLAPYAGGIDISDIAFHLGAICRWGGTTRKHYSVAEHSVMLARHFLQLGDHEAARWALLHDAAEAYLGDVVRPLKPALEPYLVAERRLEQVIWQKYDLHGDLPAVVKAADSAILGDERDQLFGPNSLHARHKRPGETGLGIVLPQWPRSVATFQFSQAFECLFAGRLSS